MNSYNSLVVPGTISDEHVLEPRVIAYVYVNRYVKYIAVQIYKICTSNIHIIDSPRTRNKSITRCKVSYSIFTEVRTTPSATILLASHSSTIVLAIE